jgi:hypothetical protein
VRRRFHKQSPDVEPAPALQAPDGYLVGEPSISQATFCLTSQIRDRENDVVVVDGVDTKAWAELGALWFYSHQTQGGRPCPIGSSFGPDDRLHVWKSRDGSKLYGTVFFDLSCELGRWVAGKVERGLLKGCSLAFTPIDAEALPAGQARAYAPPGNVFHAVELLEVSITPVPANQDARLVSAKRLGAGGRQVLPRWFQQEFRELERAVAVHEFRRVRQGFVQHLARTMGA